VSSDKGPELLPADHAVDTGIRRQGRLGLTLSWDSVPWWGIIILIVGVIVAYSVFTSTRYMDAIYFIFDLPWNRQMVGRVEIKNQAWSATIAELDPGQYTIYAEFLDETGNTVGSQVYRIEVPPDARKGEAPPITKPSDTLIQVRSSTPTINGTASVGNKVVLYDDFSGNVWRILVRIWGANGVLMTIRVTLISFALALVLGLVFGLMRVSSKSPDLTINAGWRLLIGLGVIILALVFIPSWRRDLTSMIIVALVIEAIMFLLPAMPYTISTLYVEIVRGVPMLVTILYIGFVLTPYLRDATNGRVDLSGLPAAIMGLSFGYGAYLSEVYRAGIQSISKGQMEAARSLGMSYSEAMRYVILPQAIRVVLPPLGNDFISMLKDSSLISVIALAEVLQQGRLWVSRNFRAFEGFNSVALMYLVMTLLLSLLVRYIERKSRLPGR